MIDSHSDGMEHGLQRPIRLVDLLAEACQLYSMHVQVYSDSRSANESLYAILGLNLVHQHSKLIQCYLAIGKSQLAVAPQVLVDERQVKGPVPASLQGPLDSIEKAGKICKFSDQARHPRVDISNSFHESAKRRGDLDRI
jgi:hypothetical protein